MLESFKKKAKKSMYNTRDTLDKSIVIQKYILELGMSQYYASLTLNLYLSHSLFSQIYLLSPQSLFPWDTWSMPYKHSDLILSLNTS